MVKSKQLEAMGPRLLLGLGILAALGIMLFPAKASPENEGEFAPAFFGHGPEVQERKFFFGEEESDLAGSKKGAGRGIASVSETAEGSAPTDRFSTDRLPAVALGQQEVAIIASDTGFYPSTVYVAKEVPVRLFVTGASKHNLCMMMDAFTIRRQLKSQAVEEISFTPASPGKYRFYCPVNGAEGTLVVRE